MVNIVAAGEIPIAGPGFASRPDGNFAPGEYRILSNVEITNDGNLRNRRGAVACGYSQGGDPTVGTSPIIREPSRFIGNLNEWALFTNAFCEIVAVSKTGRIIFWTDGVTSTWLRTSLPANNVGAYWAGFHRYNDRNWMVGVRYYNPGLGLLNFKIEVHAYNPAGASAIGNSIDPADLDTLGVPDQSFIITNPSIATFQTAIAMQREAYVVNTFIHRDRLWVATQSTLYFSKATDPSVWAAPDGGFFKFPDQQINAVIPCRDSIYILGDSGIWVLNYNTDPNTNATLTKISEGIGADTGCVYQDVVYFARYDNLYSLENNRVTKVLTLNYNKPPSAAWDILKMTSWQNYIIFQWQDLRTLNASGTSNRPGNPVYNLAYPRSMQILDAGAVGDPKSEPGVIWLNMENGASHAFRFADQYDLGGGSGSRMVEFFAVPFENPQNEALLWFTTDNAAMGGGEGGFAYHINYDTESHQQGDSRNDYVAQTAGGIVMRTAKLDVEIPEWSPDGSKFFMKRFRSLITELTLRKAALVFKFAYADGQALSLPILADTGGSRGTPGSNVRPAFPYRFNMNQRGRCLTINISAPLTTLTYPGDMQFWFELNRLSVLYAQSTRAPVVAANRFEGTL